MKNNRMAEITMLVTFHVAPGYREVFRAALIEDAKGARTEAGNITMELYEHRDNPSIFYLFERWENHDALDEHFKKPYTLNVLELNKTALTVPMQIQYLSDIAPLAEGEFKQPVDLAKSINLVVIFEVKDGLQEKFLQQFHKSVKKSRPEAGNVAYHLHTIFGESQKFALYERWKDQAALDYHFEQPYTLELFDVFKQVLTTPIEEILNYVREIE